MRRTLMIFSLLFASIASYSFAQSIQWKEIQSLPSTFRNGSAVEFSGNIFYMGGYSNSAPTGYENINLEYSPENNTWIRKSNLPSGRSNFALVSNNGYIYAIGGDPFSAKNECYNPKNDSWTTLPPMKTPRQHINGIVVDDKIYIIGGLIFLGSYTPGQWTFKNATDKNEAYDINKRVWVELSPMPSKRHNVFLIKYGKKIFAFGGMGTESDVWKSLKTVEVYDTENNKWSKKSDMPQALDGFSIYEWNGMVYIIGGFSGNMVQKDAYVYNIKKDEWKKSSEFPNVNNGGAASTGISNKIYIIGGSDSNFNTVSNCFVGEISK
jgi:N-acetylneuraminic acid mutarotase